MTDPKKTLVVALLDRSGSMASIKEDAEGAFNTFVMDQRKLNADDRVFVSLYQFDRTSEVPMILHVDYEWQLLESVPPLTLHPRGMTPLNDALAGVIRRVGNQLEQMPEELRPGKVIVFVMTDGHENNSVEFAGHHGAAKVRQMVEHQTEVYSWEFIFAGAGIDAFAVAGGLGIKRESTISVAATGQGMYEGYAAASNLVANSRMSDGKKASE